MRYFFVITTILVVSSIMFSVPISGTIITDQTLPTATLEIITESENGTQLNGEALRITMSEDATGCYMFRNESIMPRTDSCSVTHYWDKQFFDFYQGSMLYWFVPINSIGSANVYTYFVSQTAEGYANVTILDNENIFASNFQQIQNYESHTGIKSIDLYFEYPQNSNLSNFRLYNSVGIVYETDWITNQNLTYNLTATYNQDTLPFAQHYFTVIQDNVGNVGLEYFKITFQELPFITTTETRNNQVTTTITKEVSYYYLTGIFLVLIPGVVRRRSG